MVGLDECPVCEEPLERLLDIAGVPVMTTVVWPTADQARHAAAGDLHLGICPSCGLIRNRAFDAALVAYDASYENSQHFSPTFRAHAHDLVTDLASRYSLAGSTVVELGCGKGEFLSMLSEVAGCRGLGFDPTYDGEVDDTPGDVTIVRALFGPTSPHVDAALVCSRHVLEHVEDPVAFLRDLRSSVEPGTPVYIEVPDGGYVLSAGGLWDLIYPHVSYFTAPSLELMLRHCGFDVTSVRSVFDGQFLAVEAVVADREPTEVAADAAAVAPVLAAARRMPQLFDETVGRWRAVVAEPDGRSTVVWGAGAKGVSFLNFVDGGDHVDAVVDLNPRKHGTFVPGTSYEVVAPKQLAGTDVGRVVVMNPAYRDEISRDLRALGLDAQILCV